MSDKMEIYKKLESGYTIKQKFKEHYEKCRKEKEQLEQECLEQIHLFLTFLGFRKVPDTYDDWQRERDDGVLETVTIGRNYYGVFLDGDYTYEEMENLRYLLGSGIVISCYGSGAEIIDDYLECIDVLSFLWKYFQEEFDELEEKLGV